MERKDCLTIKQSELTEEQLAIDSEKYLLDACEYARNRETIPLIKLNKITGLKSGIGPRTVQKINEAYGFTDFNNLYIRYMCYTDEEFREYFLELLTNCKHNNDENRNGTAMNNAMRKIKQIIVKLGFSPKITS